VRLGPLNSERRSNLPGRQKKHHTILHFCCDPAALVLRGQFLNQVGYRVLNSSNGFEVIALSTSKRVHAVVLDLEHNREDVTLIAQEIKRLRPQVPTLVLTEGTLPVGEVHEIADALVPKEHGPEVLVRSLEELLDDYSETVV
jgi:DNA-binding response OmpR family regulator